MSIAHPVAISTIYSSYIIKLRYERPSVTMSAGRTGVIIKEGDRW